MIDSTQKARRVSREPRNDEVRLLDVGKHMPIVVDIKGNCAVCSKRIRKEHDDAYAATPKQNIPPVPYVPRPSIRCNMCNVYLCFQNGKKLLDLPDNIFFNNCVNNC